MKKLFLFLSCLMASCSSFEESFEHRTARIRAQVAKELVREIPRLEWIGTEGSIGDKISSVGLLFKYYGPLSQEESGALALTCANHLLEALNADAKLQPHLSNHPFSLENVEVYISLYAIDRRDLPSDQIHGVTLSHGQLHWNK